MTTRGRQRRTALTLAGSLLGLAGVALAPSAGAVPAACDDTTPAIGQLVSCYGGSDTITVPAGATSAGVSVGGAGGGGDRGAGGAGALVVGEFDTTGISSLDVVAGLGGAGRNNATGNNAQGGQFSAVLDGSTALVVAGGGGGGGSSNAIGGDAAYLGTTAGEDGDDYTFSTNVTTGGGGGDDGIGGAAGTGTAVSPNTSHDGSPGEDWADGGAGGSGAVYNSASKAGGGGGGYGGGGGGGYSTAGPRSGGGAGGSYAHSGVHLVAMEPAGGVGGAGGTNSVDGEFGEDGWVEITFHAAAPTITSVQPATGSTAGGSTLTVTGTSFLDGSTVTVGGVACTSPVVVPLTQITCVTPAHAAGPADVEVTTAAGVATAVGAYSYSVPTPPPAPAPSAPGAPRSVTATAGTSSVVVSWSAPASGPAVDHYEVTADPGDATCRTSSTTCVLGGVAGTSYTVSVVAVTGNGDRSAAATGTSAAVTAPEVAPTVPAAPLTLTTDQGRITTVEVGQDVVVIGTGFAPYSTATIVIYSDPIVLGTVVTDGRGDFTKPVTVPRTLAPGLHSMVASGVDPQGQPHSMRMDVSVSAAGAADGPSLASTGASVGLPLGLGAGTVALGALLILGARRRGAAAGTPSA